MSNYFLQIKPCFDIEHYISVLKWSEYVKLCWNLNTGKGIMENFPSFKLRNN